MHTQETKTPKAVRRLALGVALLGLAGCYPPSALEMDYGNSVRNNTAQQVLNPRAGYNPKPAVGLSPQAAVGEMDKYDKSFTPEKVEKKELKIKLD
ncbi:MAG: hypothetical protein Q8L43_00165 [Deltaproteobacteria bacterium]|nr:hypothetical protein [Deltaproteobacteria bacterium]